MNFGAQLTTGVAASLSAAVVPKAVDEIGVGASPLLVSWYKWNAHKELKKQ